MTTSMDADDALAEGGNAPATVLTLDRRTPLSVAIVDAVPSYRLGLSVAFADAGFDTDTDDSTDIDEWIRVPGRRVLVITVAVPEDCEVLRRFGEANSEVLIVALLRQPAPEMYVRALQAGASGAAPWTSSPETVIAVVQSALHDHVLLPHDVVQSIAAGVTLSADLRSIGSAEVKWLQMMAKGSTVGEVAQAVGYSEREMFRLLRHVYDRMGVQNRTEALLKAAQCGLLA
jgi:DNA-binding NarL/FixJ family response regulator